MGQENGRDKGKRREYVEERWGRGSHGRGKREIIVKEIPTIPTEHKIKKR